MTPSADDDPLPRIQADTAKAMKAGDKARVGTLRMIASDLKKAAIDTGVLVVTGDAALAVLRRAVKTRNEAADVYAKAGRADLAAQERAEAAVVEEYLPKAASEAQIREVVAAVIAERGLKAPSGTGAAIKESLARLGGTADGKAVSKIAAELLRPA